MRGLVVVAAILAASACSRRSELPPGALDPPSPPPPVAPPPASAPPAETAATTKLFAQDVPGDALALSIAIETLGGVSTVLIPRDTALPARRVEVFSTATDNQSSVEVHIVQGERPMAADNRSLGRFQLTGIPPAARGVPQIEVTFAVDTNGVLAVSAVDRATRASREIRIEGGKAGLDRRQIDSILAEAAAGRDADEQKQAFADARNQLEALVYSSRKLLPDAADKLPAELRQRWAQAIARAEKVLAESTAPRDLKRVRAATASLSATVHTATEALYETAR